MQLLAHAQIAATTDTPAGFARIRNGADLTCRIVVHPHHARIFGGTLV
ncbi:hypothetical protein [Paracoccus shanxieyensis]|uniref:Uncharacterized protein n=1 Tax=Paracoccus shanxieyensis TaxID=2675752 RepID=A0A6L6IWI7_9RHOB|nr:hypothetical protein [Paracoccus shanxieyensis]MTH63978.1 hypothetical protein [Paracoccus shanxieyensis]MTH86981.1 hypothetical protein [Paracoccus shanxieyensis]